MNITTGKKIFLSQANGVVPANKPIVFWDTCALLDLARTPLLDRTNLSFATLQEYEQIEQWINSDRLTSVTSDLVLREFSEHIDHIASSLSTQEQKTKNEVKEQTLFMTDLSRARKINQSIDGLDVQKKVIAIVKKIWSHTILLRGQNSFALSADYRVRNYIKPSGGKESYKDCYIWYSYISLLREVNPLGPTFFFTTNPSDFAENKKSINLHPDLKAELPFAQSSFALNMSVLHGKLLQYFRIHP